MTEQSVARATQLTNYYHADYLATAYHDANSRRGTFDNGLRKFEF